MTSPFDGLVTEMLSLGLSPWILPLIAIAAKRKEDEARALAPGRALLRWWRGARRPPASRAGTSRSTRAARRRSRP